ncbi:TetR/AcrR family transcriptional regulator [Nocardiopsis sp. RSe5-2]|uniref:TetR/AcrR family transcriptional regulator n=1 Tax=Nocardiopsis endophytica TaxID=3018445 RepID=A0ABT4TWI3_9ACTN|nr:TetR/AcrR family transcriptional regulator [Nocardiopsis endophytica]MDA2809069.1 TetR/AcrR family transcriptional regulator [Nocardiopsis endophytica]
MSEDGVQEGAQEGAREGAQGRRGGRRQERGRRRMEQILDAAEEVVAEQGFEDTTTNAIAARAGVSPGSLYQFFRNKEEVLDGLVERYTATSREFWSTRLSDGTARMSAEELVRSVLTGVSEFKTRRPAFWVLFHGSAASPRLERVASSIRADIGRRLTEVFLLRAPGADPARMELLAAMCIATVQGVFPMVMEAGEERRAEIVVELTRMLAGYLGPEIGAEPPA